MRGYWLAASQRWPYLLDSDADIHRKYYGKGTYCSLRSASKLLKLVLLQILVVLIIIICLNLYKLCCHVIEICQQDILVFIKILYSNEPQIIVYSQVEITGCVFRYGCKQLASLARVTASRGGGDTRIKLIFCGWIKKEHWINDVGGWEWWGDDS